MVKKTILHYSQEKSTLNYLNPLDCQPIIINNNNLAFIVRIFHLVYVHMRINNSLTHDVKLVRII